MAASAVRRPLPLGLGILSRRQLGALAAALLLLLLFPVLDRNSSHVSSVVDAGVFVLLVFGLNIVVGFAGLLDLGYAAFFAIGAYTYAMVASAQFGLHFNFWPMILASAAVAACFGVILGAPTLRLRGDYLAIVTLGFGEIVPQVFLNLDKYTGGPNGISAVDQPKLLSYAFGFNPTPYYYVIFIVICLCVILINNLRHSRIGRAWMAIREDELAAAHMGINTTTTKLLAFAMGAAFAGLAGVIYAAKLTLISPDEFNFSVSVTILAAIVLGGMGNVLGVLIGGVLLALLNYLVLPQATNWTHALGAALHSAPLQHIDFTNYRFMLYGSILVLVMLFRPEGLVPSAARRAELHAEQEAGAAVAAQEQAEYGGAQG
jgi:branched-chain amino acid transport system permease protein